MNVEIGQVNRGGHVNYGMLLAFFLPFVEMPNSRTNSTIVISKNEILSNVRLFFFLGTGIEF